MHLLAHLNGPPADRFLYVRVSYLSSNSLLPLLNSPKTLSDFSNSASVRSSTLPLMASSKLSQTQNCPSRLPDSCSNSLSGSRTSSAYLTESFLKFFLKYSLTASACSSEPDSATSLTTLPIQTESVAPTMSALEAEPREENRLRPYVLSLWIYSIVRLTIMFDL